MEKNFIARSWWSYLLGGIIWIALGIILLSWPDSTVRVLLYIVGIFALIGGAIDLIRSIVLASQKEKWVLSLVSGLVGLLIGGVIISRPDVALAVVIAFIAIWTIIVGFVEIVVAFDLPPMSGRGLIGVLGAISIIIGIILIAYPIETVWVAIIIISIYAFAVGIMRIIIAFYALSLERKMAKEEKAAEAA